MPTSKKKPTSAGAKRKPAGPFELVWNIVRRVPRGRVVTYGQLSEMIDRRLSAVGTGWAVRAAPEGLIPWHRVVNSQGGISTDREHPGLQRAMLEAEGVVFNREGHMDLARVGWRGANEPLVAKRKKKRKSERQTRRVPTIASSK